MTVNATTLGSVMRQASRRINDTLEPGRDADEYFMRTSPTGFRNIDLSY
jgi:hypothetical protein